MEGNLFFLSFTEDEQVVKKILKHLGLLEVKAGPPPRVKPSPPNIDKDYSDSQIPASKDYLYRDRE
jgi:hypothetical protein